MRKGGTITYQNEVLIFEGKECWELVNKTVDHVVFKTQQGEKKIFTHQEYENIIKQVRQVQVDRTDY